ncbi:MAG: hypothetical protein Q8L85_08280 [Alphaproteobacteria bacterium]|nr:hypothetical protein [Alphaproteobacteria bacterium]
MNNKLFLLINFLICSFLSFQASAFIPKSIEIDENIFFNDILLDGFYKNWQYYPFQFEAVGLKKIISIKFVHKKPKLITTKAIQKKDGWFPAIFKMCIPDLLNLYDSSNEFNKLDILKTGILGRYALKFEIIYEQYLKEHLVVSTDYFFMLYKQNKNQRISNLESNFGNQSDINIILQEKEAYCSDGEDVLEEEIETESLMNDDYPKETSRFNAYNFLSCFTISWHNIFGTKN